MYWNSSPVTLHIFGQSVSASIGTFYLPGAYDSFLFTSVAPSNFIWIGQ
jgi:hypothetical protein